MQNIQVIKRGSNLKKWSIENKDVKHYNLKYINYFFTINHFLAPSVKIIHFYFSFSQFFVYFSTNS